MRPETANAAGSQHKLLFVSGAAPCTVTPCVTSATDSIVSKTAITVTYAGFTASLEAKSVTTFVGKP
jgi:O-glycosyl hydrolase